MIIKSMPRKRPDFQRLYDYINRGCERDRVFPFVFSRNLFHGITPQIVSEFQTTARLLKQRKGGRTLCFHEVLSLQECSLPKHEQYRMLNTIVNRYLNTRAKHQHVYGAVHTDGKYPHAHLMISSNVPGSRKRAPLSRAEFQKIKTELESWVLESFPQLEQKHILSRSSPSLTRPSHQEQEMKRRTGTPSNKDQVRQTLSHIFVTAANRNDLLRQLSASDFSLYQRGQLIGIKDATGRKYRLRTLGVDALYQSMMLSWKQGPSRPSTDTPTRSRHAAPTPKDQHERLREDIQRSVNNGRQNELNQIRQRQRQKDKERNYERERD